MQMDTSNLADSLIRVAPSDLVSNALKTIIDATKMHLDKHRASTDKTAAGSDELWEILMQMDSMSVRQFFSS